MVMVMMVVMVMMMLMVMIVMMPVVVVRHIQGFLFLPVHRHLHVGAADAAFFGFLRLHFDPRQPEGVHPAEEGFPVRHQLQQGSGQHIPCSAHVALDIQRPHGPVPPVFSVYSRSFSAGGTRSDSFRL